MRCDVDRCRGSPLLCSTACVFRGDAGWIFWGGRAISVLSYDGVFDLRAEPHPRPRAGRGILDVTLLQVERPPVGRLGEALAVVRRGLVGRRAADVVVV